MTKSISSRHARIEALYAQGLNDTEIASRLGCSPRTVANYRREKGLPSNAHHMQTARYGERLVVEQGQASGWPTSHMAELHRDHPFDVLINGWRAEVKTVHDSEDPGVFKFFLSPNRRGIYADPSQFKDYAQDCDFVVLVCKPRTGQEPQVFVMTPAETGEYVRINLNQPHDYEQYRDAWHRLSQPRLGQPTPQAA